MLAVVPVALLVVIKGTLERAFARSTLLGTNGRCI
jgi:hypothetical protein